MSVLGLAACLLNRHGPSRRDVKWDGLAFVGECRHCGAPIERVGRRNWRKQKQE
jgi:hypothetical protein